MRSVYIAAPFKASLDSGSGELEASLRRRLMKLITFFTERGFSVHNAHQREDWGRNLMSREECTRTDFEEIKACAWFVALPGYPASPGTHIEIGWASALGKQIILLLEANNEYAFLVHGLHKVTKVQYVYFENDEDCLAKLTELFPFPS